MTLEKVTKFMITLIIFIVLTFILTLMDSHMPIATFRIGLTNSIQVRIAIYDSDNGFLGQIFSNVKCLMSSVKGN